MLYLQKKNTKKHASSSCARAAFILLGISWEQLGIWYMPLESKTPWSVSMEQQTRSSLGRITMQCYMHTLWCMVPVHRTLDLECMLMIAFSAQLLIDVLSQENVENCICWWDTLNDDGVWQGMDITYHKSMADVHGHGDDPEAAHPCWACWSMGRTPVWSRKYVAIILYPLAAGHCHYVSCLSHYLESILRSDHYTSSDHNEGIQRGLITVRQTEAQFYGVWIGMTLEKTVMPIPNSSLALVNSHQPWINTGELLEFWQRCQSRQRQWHTWIWMTPSTTMTSTGKPKRRHRVWRK